MNMDWKDLAQAVLAGNENQTMGFPQSVQILMGAGFDDYAVDFRRHTRTYYFADGQSHVLQTAPTSEPVSERFDAAMLREAIGEAQTMAPGYTYMGFCAKVATAGCAGYLVSFVGKRVLYYGRTGETHTEYFPGTQRREE